MSQAADIFKFCFGCDPGELPGKVIISPVFPVKKFKEFCGDMDVYTGRLYKTGIASRGNKKVAVIYSGMGDRLLGDAVLLLKESDVKEIVFLGTCGGFKPCGIGDIVIGCNAFNGEGFSRYVSVPGQVLDVISGGDKFFPSEEFTQSLYEYLLSGEYPGIKIMPGSVYTIGSLVAETEETLEILNKNGVIAVDMELSAVYSAASYSGIKIAALMTVADLPGEKGFWKQFTDEERYEYNSSINMIMRSAVDFSFRD